MLLLSLFLLEAKFVLLYKTAAAFSWTVSEEFTLHDRRAKVPQRLDLYYYLFDISSAYKYPR